MPGLFGTDGIRGIANREPVTPEMGFRLGKALVHYLKSKGKPTVIVIGRDTRATGLFLEYALVSGITSAGGDALTAGIMPTPAVAYLTRTAAGGMGLVVSASHNPSEYNGFKLFSAKGFKLSEKEESEIENLMLSDLTDEARMTRGSSMPLDNAKERYLSFLKGTLPPGFSLKGFRLVLDCANGATFRTAPDLFQDLGAEVQAVYNAPDGENINRECGSEHTEKLEQMVLDAGADAGLAFDGDGDRLAAVDEKGKALTGDQVLAICAQALKGQGRLEKHILVSTVMSNMGLGIALKSLGIKHVTSDVGDRRVMEEMLRLDASIGGEDSGHIIFRNHHSTGDGILSALQLLLAAKMSGRPLSALSTLMQVYPQYLINVKVRQTPELSSVRGVAEALEAAEKALGDDGRVLLRYSGTEPLCRVMVEGRKREQIESYAKAIAKAVEEQLG